MVADIYVLFVCSVYCVSCLSGLRGYMSGLPFFLPTSNIASVLCTCISMYVVILQFCIHVNKCALYVPACVGRSTMKQYMPMKPVNRGFKVWVRADAVNGYFCDFDVYVGGPGDGTSVETRLGERVVKELTETMQGKHYQIFCDNFSSCTLFDDLLQQGLYACGTTRTTRRGYPTTLKGITLERGKCFVSGGIWLRQCGWTRSL